MPEKVAVQLSKPNK